MASASRVYDSDSSRIVSDTKNMRGNACRFVSRYPVRHRCEISSWSRISTSRSRSDSPFECTIMR
jgi:hypothetical protein